MTSGAVGELDVLAGAEPLVEATKLFEVTPGDGHVGCRREPWPAAHRRPRTRRCRDRIEGRGRVERVDVEPAGDDAAAVGGVDGVDERPQPVRRHHVVGVTEREHLARGRSGTDVAGMRRSRARRGVDEPQPWVGSHAAPHQGDRAVGRPVVGHDHLEHDPLFAARASS